MSPLSQSATAMAFSSSPPHAPRIAVFTSSRDAEPPLLGGAVGFAVGFGVGFGVGLTVGFGVGSGVGCGVATGVGEAVAGAAAFGAEEALARGSFAGVRTSFVGRAVACGRLSRADTWTTVSTSVACGVVTPTTHATRQNANNRRISNGL